MWPNQLSLLCVYVCLVGFLRGHSCPTECVALHLFVSTTGSDISLFPLRFASFSWLSEILFFSVVVCTDNYCCPTSVASCCHVCCRFWRHWSATIIREGTWAQDHSTRPESSKATSRRWEVLCQFPFMMLVCMPSFVSVGMYGETVFVSSKHEANTLYQLFCVHRVIEWLWYCFETYQIVVRSDFLQPSFCCQLLLGSHESVFVPLKRGASVCHLFLYEVRLYQYQK